HALHRQHGRRQVQRRLDAGHHLRLKQQFLQSPAFDRVLLEQDHHVLGKERTDLIEPAGDARERASLHGAVRDAVDRRFPFAALDLIAGINGFEGFVELALVAAEDRLAGLAHHPLQRFLGGFAKNQPPACEIGRINWHKFFSGYRSSKLKSFRSLRVFSSAPLSSASSASLVASAETPQYSARFSAIWRFSRALKLPNARRRKTRDRRKGSSSSEAM